MARACTVSAMEPPFQEIVDLLDRELIGKLGEGYSDTLRTIIMSWLSEKGYFTKGRKSGKE